MSDQNRLDWLRLARTETVGPVTFHRLLSKYKTATKALEALPVLTKNKPITLCTVSAAERELDHITKHHGRLLLSCDADYPATLSALEDAPPVLTVLGNPALLGKESIAVVGSRNASLNARKLTHKIASDLGEAGYIVTSGLARGIDTSAHEGALKTGTVAVVAGGADVIYPKENTELYRRICEDGGAVVSECAWNTQPIAQHFPKRNRIVSGLSAGTVIIEAGLRSGSLITARTAAEQGRDVMAVPGFPLDPRSEGTNALIRDGATLVRDSRDIIEQIGSFLSGNARKTVKQADFGFSEPPSDDDFTAVPDEDISALILPDLSVTPISVDEIVRLHRLRTADVQGSLLQMELEGLILRLPGNRVCLAG